MVEVSDIFWVLSIKFRPEKGEVLYTNFTNLLEYKSRERGAEQMQKQKFGE